MVFCSVELLTAVTDGAVVTQTDKWQLLAGWLLFESSMGEISQTQKESN